MADAKLFSDEEISLHKIIVREGGSKDLSIEIEKIIIAHEKAIREEEARFLATITSDRKRFEETLDGYTKDWAEQKRGFQKRIEELELSIRFQKAEYDDHEKTWFQIIESWTNQHPVSQREAVRFLERFAMKKKQFIADQTATIKRLRGVLEKIPTLTLDDDPDSPFEKGFSYPGCILCSVKDKFARQALDAKEE